MTSLRMNRWAAGAIGVAILAGLAGAQSVAQSPEAPSWQPRYNENGELLQPIGYREWVYLGSPLTPNALNNGHAGFPEFHNVYLPKSLFDEYKRTGTFPEGAIWVKELQLTLPSQNPDGSRQEPSGRGYFPGAFNGMDVMVKDSAHCPETKGWCFYNFGHHALPYASSASRRPLGECGGCHLGNADKDMHFMRFYAALLP